MKKLYSYVLLAVGLLIGTNAWAELHDAPQQASDEAKVQINGGAWQYASTLKEAFDAVEAGQTGNIELLKHIWVEAPITMPGTIPTYANGKGRLHEVEGQNITLNLNGFNITTATPNVTPFRILKGSLDIEGNGVITKEHTNRYKANGTEKVYGEPDWYGGAVIAISGAQDSLAADWSVLTIGKDVTLQFNKEIDADSKVLKSKTIAITNFAGLGWYKVASGTTAYNGTTYTQGEGTDFLARKYDEPNNENKAIDPISPSDQINKFGYCTRAAKAASSYKYTDDKNYMQAVWQGNEDDFGTVQQIADKIAANKDIFPMGWGVLSGTNTFDKGTENEKIYYYNILQGCAFGVKVIIKGNVLGSYYGVHFHGNINQTPEGLDETKTRHEANAPYFTHQFPYVKVENTATVSAANDGSCVGIYVAGYGVMDVEGDVSGATGIYMKSGDVVCKDANVWSTFTGDAAFNWGTNGDGGTHGAGGNAIVAETSDAYAGSMGVTLQGDTKVTGATGYAIYDQTTVTTTTEDDVTTYSTTNHITIEGGTIAGGNLGTIAITQGAVDATSISGGNVEGTSVQISNPTTSATITIPTTDFIPEGNHTTVVKDGDKDIVVVSNGGAPDTKTTLDAIIAAYTAWVNGGKQGEAPSVKATGTLGDLKQNLELKELEINETTSQTLTIKAGYTLTVGRVILGANAQIIVEPGAKFIVTGSDGIVAPVVSNIVLRANATDQATFLFNPAVKSNREPNATVQMYTNSKQLTENPWTYVFQRFALPVKESAAPANDYTNQQLFGSETAFESYVFGLNYSSNQWAPLSWTDMKSFTSYQLANNTANGGITYTFTGKIYGNTDNACAFNAQGFGYFGNSYMAPIAISELISDFGADVNKAVWIYNYNAHKYDVLTPDASIFGSLPKEIKSMQAFVLHLDNGAEGNAPINYANAVWGNPNITKAPARNRVNTLSNGALINVVAENGMADQVILMEKDSYTGNFDNGADAAKLMVEEGINLYVTTVYGDQSIVAENNLENTLITFKAGEATNYTLQLGTVFGEDYSICDNMTGAIIDCAEGFEYNFTQEANSTAFGRFEIVGRQNMPTAIDNTEAVKSAKGIYTITGQYVGENLNVLPAGVYVVNGVKIVK